MSKKNVHVVPHSTGWAVRIEGNERVSSLHSTKQQAMEIARNRARDDEVELVIHGRNGQIQDKDSYGPDQCPPRDSKH